MNENYTHITMILDRTGSMESIRHDTIGGFNAFLQGQKAAPGTATLTLVQFDSQDPYEVVHNFVPIALAAELTPETYVPRASTPLFDALGRGILDLERNLTRLAPEQRPCRVVFVVITDGEENASREFTCAQVQKMIHEKQAADGWDFVFLSADLSAIAEAVALGVAAGATLAFDKNVCGTRDAFFSLSENMAELRKMPTSARMAFHDEDRAKQQSEKHRKQDPGATPGK
jgi:hypothetical protein